MDQRRARRLRLDHLGVDSNLGHREPFAVFNRLCNLFTQHRDPRALALNLRTQSFGSCNPSEMNLLLCSHQLSSVPLDRRLSLLDRKLQLLNPTGRVGLLTLAGRNIRRVSVLLTEREVTLLHQSVGQRLSLSEALMRFLESLGVLAEHVHGCLGELDRRLLRLNRILLGLGDRLESVPALVQGRFCLCTESLLRLEGCRVQLQTRGHGNEGRSMLVPLLGERREALPNLLLPLRLTSSGSLSPLTNSVDHGVERIARLPDRVGEFLDDLIRARLTILEIVHTMATLAKL